MKRYSLFNYNLILQKEQEGGYTVKVPALPGCITYGKTLEEAKLMAANAIKSYISSLLKHGENIPTDDTLFITSVTLQLPVRRKKTYA